MLLKIFPVSISCFFNNNLFLLPRHHKNRFFWTFFPCPFTVHSSISFFGCHAIHRGSVGGQNLIYKFQTSGGEVDLYQWGGSWLFLRTSGGESQTSGGETSPLPPPPPPPLQIVLWILVTCSLYGAIKKLKCPNRQRFFTQGVYVILHVVHKMSSRPRLHGSSEMIPFQ